jgi:glucosamine-6-phosphate deaminase
VSSHVSVVRLDDAEAVGNLAAALIENRLAGRSLVHMLLPAGHTALPFYVALRRLNASGSLMARRGRVLQLDEYCGLEPGDPHNHRSLLERELDGTGLVLSEAFDANARDLAIEAQRYEDALGAHEIDVAVLGIGRDGRVAFNERGSHPSTRTHVVALTDATRRTALHDFGSLDKVPTHALSVGLDTLLDARELLLLATGTVKAAALRDMLTGPPRADLPASLLRIHPRLTVICDRDAASELRPEPGWGSDHVIVVLGHRDPDSRAHRASHQSFGRLAVAAHAARRDPTRAAVLTGFSSTGGLSEAEQMAEEWYVADVPTLLDVAGADTLGNAVCSLPLIEALGGIRRVTVVTSAWHIRAPIYFRLYEDAGYSVRFRRDWRHGPWLRMLRREFRLMPGHTARRSARHSARTRQPA